MSRERNYFTRLKATLSGVVSNLQQRGIEDRHLTFGGEGPPRSRKPSVPTDARSEFLANRAMGDWAERSLGEALARALEDLKVVQYGNTDRIAAGHPEFKSRYLAGLEETRLYGKRPDLLLFPRTVSVKEDLSALGHKETCPLVKQAVAAVEVRSSKYEALRYMLVRKEQKEAGQAGGRDTPSFTVKVEDLVIVYRWIEACRKPQTYCQVFFDSVFAINFLDIFSHIASAERLLIEKPEKSQEKATIMIPIILGTQIGRARSIPEFTAAHRVTKLGRHDAYVVPQGGGFVLDAGLTKKVLQIE